MSASILYRGFGVEEGELAAMRRHFRCFESRLDIRRGDLVVGRYSVLPFYEEQERDVVQAGATLINTHRQHLYVADLGNWTQDLADMTPRTWARLEDLPEVGGPYVVKGCTNSFKQRWKTHMFARSKAEAITVALRLQTDSYIGQQHTYVREYVPLRDYGVESIGGCPVSNEFRFFVCRGEILCGGFYWTSHAFELGLRGVPIPRAEQVPKDFLRQAVERVGDKIPFYALDVAEKKDGGWIVVELNDAQMSGLSDNDPDVLYGRLAEVLR